MAQATDYLCAVDAKIEYSDDGGSTWADISGYANSVNPGEQTREVGTYQTASGDTEIVCKGKRTAMGISIEALYAEAVMIDDVRTAFENGDQDFQIRWSPDGGDVGDYQYTSANGILSAWNEVGGGPGADNVSPARVSFTLTTPKVTKSTIAA